MPLVSPDVWAVGEGADLARKGLLPVAGGTLDQAHGFMQAVRAWWAEEAPYRTTRED